MIARTWRGWTRPEDVERYLEYLRRTGVSDFASTEGNRGSAVLCRREGDRAEFLILSLWDSMDAVRRFAGADPERAVFYPEDDDFLLEREWTVSHHEVLDDALRSGSGAASASVGRP